MVTLDTNPVRAEVSRAWPDACQGDLRTGHALYRLKMPKRFFAWRVWLSEAAERQRDRSLAFAFGECVLDLLTEALEIGAAQLCALELR